MIMLDYPASDCPSIRGQWAAFEDMLAKNGTLSIAVSNFSPDQLDCIVSNKVRPHALTRSPARAFPPCLLLGATDRPFFLSPDPPLARAQMQSSTPPAVNQLPYAVGSGKDTSVADDAAKGGVVVQAYSPLNSGSLATDPDCAAIGKRHGKSAAQVALRWIVQRNATLYGHSAACPPEVPRPR